MELYKFISENEIRKYKGGFVVLDNRVYTNPTEEIIRKAGFKCLKETQEPEYNPETEYLITTYQDGDEITPIFEVKKAEEMEDTI